MGDGLERKRKLLENTEEHVISISPKYYVAMILKDIRPDSSPSSAKLKDHAWRGAAMLLLGCMRRRYACEAKPLKSFSLPTVVACGWKKSRRG